MIGVATDGSPIEVYRRLPALGEPELVASAVPAGATILELGCGAGRITHPLVSLGYAVSAVDNSESMLAEVRGAETLLAEIETLELGRRFDCVLLASHFVNDADAGLRLRILRTCARHVDPAGVVLIEAYPPTLNWQAGRETVAGDVTIRLAEVVVADTHVLATIEYEVDGRVWRQPFEAELLGDDELAAALEAAGLAFDRWLDRDRGWLVACPR